MMNSKTMKNLHKKIKYSNINDEFTKKQGETKMPENRTTVGGGGVIKTS